ncbi:uncharacterized protein LOC108911323 [Anoplophora glabripennis]|uniref:uncharacterized protein LOC108911323 n=1 Tax=Anoplophora glabripennis TaxID=217634 RepID=UPI0008749F95|nr:uncharacterized protein LOC108911323 [Anoplophora glabripennis]XP_018571749.1 uncharacterized protein LOC108911323 [Anoplophora glabripennis]
MDEDECDYRTPVGKVIKHINYLCKKPPFDNQLNEAIDLFHEKLSEQEKYLANGIFKINFAESALFLQSCAELYGKKIDLLFKELLEFHTRLIRYDCEHQKEKGIPINKEVVEKLEERRNKYLRKKNFKLLQEENEEACVVNLTRSEINEITTDYLINGDGRLFETEDRIVSNQMEEENKSVQIWRDIELEVKEQLKIPYAVYKQMIRTYRLKNYPILRFADFDILDLEDGEFNTKYSRVPGWHHIFHLIEYNDEGLLPDNNNLIAKLKLTVNGKMKFLSNRKLPFDTPFEQYKNDYIEYRNQFFKEEAKKWQNMPLNTFEDFRKQLELLTHMYGKNKIDRSSVKDSSSHKTNDKIEILDNSDEDSLFELTFSCDKEFTKSDLFVRLEKLSGDIINTKLRQDSGYYDCSSGSESDNVETVNEENAAGSENHSSDNANTDINTDGTAADADVNKDNISANSVTEDDNTNCTDNVIPINNITADGNSNCTNNINPANNVTVTVDSNGADGVNPAATAGTADDDNFDTRSIVSDHDYCLTPPIADALIGLSTDHVTEKGDIDKTVEGVIKKPSEFTKVPKAVKSGESRKKHQINKEPENDESPPKRRKLSQKQIEVLLRSKIKPTKLLKFEKFFSENYQSEEGEGKVPSVEYDSDAENIDTVHNGDKNDCDDLDDTRSIISDHSYCQPLPDGSRNDSGFIEPISLPTQSNEETDNQPNVEEELSLEEEFERLSTLLQENQSLNSVSEQQSLPSVPTEIDIMEKEWEEAQARVEEWRNTINPILKNLKEHDFDIHEYGSRIIDGMEINESKLFRNVVQGKSSAEVVRYFISSLQLANTNNIEICGAKRGELSNDTYSVKLLSKDRFHEHLKDYTAPSEDTLAEKLERVRAMNAQQGNSGPSKAKQIKLSDKSSKGKIFNNNTKNKIVVKVTKLPSNAGFPQREPSEILHSTYQHNKENCSSLSPVFPDNTVKGKGIMKRQVNTQHILNFDISVPSTSRHNLWSDIPSQCEDQMPSTSSQNFSPRNPDLFEEDQRRCPRVYPSSPNKRRQSDSSEESFLDRLITTQRLNPDIQVHSTPHGPTPAKQVKISSSLKKSFLF